MKKLFIIFLCFLVPSILLAGEGEVVCYYRLSPTGVWGRFAFRGLDLDKIAQIKAYLTAKYWDYYLPNEDVYPLTSIKEEDEIRKNRIEINIKSRQEGESRQKGEEIFYVLTFKSFGILKFEVEKRYSTIAFLKEGLDEFLSLYKQLLYKIEQEDKK